VRVKVTAVVQGLGVRREAARGLERVGIGVGTGNRVGVFLDGQVGGGEIQWQS
jgi:hypothetical protein